MTDEWAGKIAVVIIKRKQIAGAMLNIIRILKRVVQENREPIKPENRKRYPANWKDIRKDILKRADNKCEFCGIENYAIRENGSKVVLTIAHLDHTPENCDYSNLRALCQRCHNRYDAKHRAETRRKAGATYGN